MILIEEERPETTEELGARGADVTPNEIFQAGVDAGAKDQLKKVVMEGEVYCTHDNGGSPTKSWACPICRQALVKEIE